MFYYFSNNLSSFLANIDFYFIGYIIQVKISNAPASVRNSYYFDHDNDQFWRIKNNKAFFLFKGFMKQYQYIMHSPFALIKASDRNPKID